MADSWKGMNHGENSASWYYIYNEIKKYLKYIFI